MGKYGLRSQLITPDLIIFGDNTIEELGSAAKEFGKKACIIYGGKSIINNGTLDKAVTILKKSGIETSTVGGVTHDPDELLVKEMVEKVKEINPDVIVGIGGGSTLDVAKAISALLTNGGEVADYWNNKKVFSKPTVPYIAVPTTSGTGSEATNNAVITSRDKSFKKSIRGRVMLPNVALVDPTLTLSMPPDVTASTGLDALIQNLEAYTSKSSGPITDTLARKGIELCGKYLLEAYNNPENLEAREAMSLASLYGGITLVNAGLGLAHGLSHPIGIKFGIPHGKACAIVMAKVIEYNYPARKEKYDEIGVLLAGIPDAVRAFNKLTEAMGISTKLSDYGITEEDIPYIIEKSKGGSRNYNPIPHDDKTVEKMLKELL